MPVTIPQQGRGALSRPSASSNTKIRPGRRRSTVSVMLLLLAVSLALGCQPRKKSPERGTSSPAAPAEATAGRPASRVPHEIHFQVEVAPEDREHFPDGFSPFVNLEVPEPDISRLRHRDEIVLPRRKAILAIDYPLSKPIEVSIEAPTAAGFSRAELVRAIGRAYHQIYETEEQTATQKTIPIDQRKGSINRNKTDGKYGICCHDLRDLVLHTVEVSERTDGTTVLALGIDS